MIFASGAVDAAATTVVRTAESTTSDLGPGLVAFLIVLLLAVATGLLMWSMVRQIRKVPPDLNTSTRGDEPPPEPVDDAPGD